MGLACHYTARAPSGNRGPKGSPGTEGLSGAAGNNGSVVELEYSSASGSRLSSLTHMRMVLHTAELDYANEKRGQSAEKLLWLLSILKECTHIGQDTASGIAEAPVGTSGPDYNHVKSIIYRSRVLLMQLSQGLDYYGYYPGHTPLTSFATYKTVIDDLLLLATDIEENYETFKDEEQGDLIQRKAINDSVAILRTKQPIIDTQKNQSVTELDQTRDQIASLLEEEDTLRGQIEKAKQAFIAAVSAEAACDLKDILNAGSAIVAIGSGAGTLYAGVQGLKAFDDQYAKHIEKEKLKDSLINYGKFTVKKLQPVGKGIGEIKTGYDKIKGILDVERDGAKLIGEESDFEEVVARFSHLSEAQEYRRLMRQFIDVVKTRNAKILHADSLITRLLELESEAEQLELELDRTSARLVSIFNPRLADHVVFFERAISRIRADILRAIVMEHRALRYWSLGPDITPTDLQDRSVNYLKIFHSRFELARLSEIERRNQAPQQFTGPVEFTFSRQTNPLEFDLLDTTGKFSFKIPPSHAAFRYYSHTLIKTAKISIIRSTPMPSSHMDWVFLLHHGDPAFVDDAGQFHYFTHRPRLRNIPYQANKTHVDIQLGGLEGRYAYLSPFATWTFMMESGTEEALQSDNIDEIKLEFSGSAFARYGV